uniref:Protein C19orf12 homolog n=1 Tax=Pogona vitticeps TaxID=103695 RepID=A0ABM5EV21_9SAUR
MLINVKDMMELLCLVSEVRKMKAAIKHSGYGAFLAGTGALLGALTGGLVGIALGGALGGALGAGMSTGKFKPVSQIIMELSLELQQQLYNEVHAIIRDLDWTDMAAITALVMTNGSIQDQVLGVLGKFLTNTIGAEIQYGK